MKVFRWMEPTVNTTGGCELDAYLGPIDGCMLEPPFWTCTSRAGPAVNFQVKRASVCESNTTMSKDRN